MKLVGYYFQRWFLFVFVLFFKLRVSVLYNGLCATCSLERSSIKSTKQAINCRHLGGRHRAQNVLEVIGKVILWSFGYKKHFLA